MAPIGGKDTGDRAGGSVGASRLPGLVVVIVGVVWLASGGQERDRATEGTGDGGDRFRFRKNGPTRTQGTLRSWGGPDFGTAVGRSQSCAFEKVGQDSPGYKGCDRLYRQALQEGRAQEQLTLAKGLVLEGDPTGAKKILEGVPSESVFHREAQDLLRDVNSLLIEAELDKAEDYAALKDWTAARRIVESVLADVPHEQKGQAPCCSRYRSCSGIRTPLGMSRKRPERPRRKRWRRILHRGRRKTDGEAPRAKAERAKPRAVTASRKKTGITKATKPPVWRSMGPGVKRAQKAYFEG